VGRRGYRVEALPRERAPACVATRDRNQDVLREEQASKRAEQATKRALTKAASKKNVDGNGDKISQGIKRTSRGGTTESSHRGPTSSLVTDAHQNEMIAEPKLSAAEGMRSARIVTFEAKAVQRNSAKSDGTLVLNKALTEAEPKFAVLESQLPMSEADNSDEGEAALGESVDTEDWEGKPTVTWNEETVYVRQRWDAHDVPGTQLSTQVRLRTCIYATVTYNHLFSFRIFQLHHVLLVIKRGKNVLNGLAPKRMVIRRGDELKRFHQVALVA